MKTICLSGGCFWGIEKYLSLLSGVTATSAGYANGHTERPSYEQVCRGDTGYAEAVRVEYDPAQISLTFLLERFYDAIDPTSLNRQGGDAGPQYRTGVYFTDAADEEIVRGSLALLQEGLDEPVRIEVCPLAVFHPAEEYHQAYLDKNPGGYCHIGAAKMEEARQSTDDAAQFRAPEKEELRRTLTGLQFEVTQNGATEPPYCNAYFDSFRPGIYVDVTTGEPLFVSTDKFESGCGWPSFSRPIAESLMEKIPDHSHGRARVEVRSARSGAHLGHVFEDGPEALGGLRYCINSASLRFVPEEQLEAEGYGHLAYLVRK